LLLNFARYRDKLKELSLQELILLNEQVMFWLNGEKYKAGDEDQIRAICWLICNSCKRPNKTK